MIEGYHDDFVANGGRDEVSADLDRGSSAVRAPAAFM